MIALASQVRVFLHRTPTDMRKSFHGLVALTESAMGQDPLSGSLFVFVNKRRDRVKILYWGQVGYCIWYQQLQQGTFQLPAKEPADGPAAIEVTRAQLSLILDGIDLSSARQRPRFKLGR
ncbi:MAG: IS66 family insertion sequence element accessory protein TnpB [Gammaproteobacteria bacterium]|nr:IS66 family insertion sequence element accessory protein TnpB [Gammaproteobacteria bacterium]